MKKIVLIISAITLAFSSCNKDKEPSCDKCKKWVLEDNPKMKECEFLRRSDGSLVMYNLMLDEDNRVVMGHFPILLCDTLFYNTVGFVSE